MMIRRKTLYIRDDHFVRLREFRDAVRHANVALLLKSPSDGENLKGWLEVADQILSSYHPAPWKEETVYLPPTEDESHHLFVQDLLNDSLEEDTLRSAKLVLLTNLVEVVEEVAASMRTIEKFFAFAEFMLDGLTPVHREALRSRFVHAFVAAMKEDQDA
jgi:hypothetical protein